MLFRVNFSAFTPHFYGNIFRNVVSKKREMRQWAGLITGSNLVLNVLPKDACRRRGVGGYGTPNPHMWQCKSSLLPKQTGRKKKEYLNKKQQNICWKKHKSEWAILLQSLKVSFQDNRTGLQWTKDRIFLAGGEKWLLSKLETQTIWAG